ncbi:hypothetical protein [Fredinandcohnia sp. 179-A 10B2 NHS]|uniref:hypothetical protein n=1 Tax=Fredinandcohnia sp. 179-A 10B2 NHS TaxID=3235176 RepID=UPI0039A23F81
MSNIFKGILFGMIIALGTAFLFMAIGQTAAGGVTSFFGEAWLYVAAVVPFVLTFAVLGRYFHIQKEVPNKKLWLISFGCAFFVTLYSGTIGAISGEAIVRDGMDTINVEGTLVWGGIYAVLLLPITTPFARLIIGLFYKYITRDRHTNGALIK